MSSEFKQHISTCVYKSFFSITIHLSTYLNSKTPSYDKNLEIPGCNLVREDHPCNREHGESVFTIKARSLLLLSLFSFGLRIGGKCCRFSCIYRSSSQTQDEFEIFLKNFELTLDKIHENNPFMTVVICDFNGKSKNWSKVNITFLDSSMIDTIASSYGLNRLIQELTHILNSSSSCINLILTLQPNFVMGSAIHSCCI